MIIEDVWQFLPLLPSNTNLGNSQKTPYKITALLRKCHARKTPNCSHHFPPAAGDITEVVVPLLAEDGGPAHQRHRLLVLAGPGPTVLQVPELYMPEKKQDMSFFIIVT